MTFYDVLGVPKDATESDITEAYRQLAKVYHADRNPGDDIAAAHYARVSEAYEVLNDPARRSEYDRTGESRAPRGEHQELLSVLVPVMMQAIQESTNIWGGDITDKDLVLAMREKVNSTLRQIEETKGKMQEGERVLEKVVGRFTSDDPADLLNMAVQSQLDHLRTQLRSVQDELDKHQRAVNYLKNVKYLRRKKPGTAAVPKAIAAQIAELAAWADDTEGK